MDIPEFFQFVQPTRVVFGAGLSADFAAEIEQLGVSRPFLVTERPLVALGFAQRIETALANAGLALCGKFDEVVPNSEVALVERGAALAREAGADCLVAIGGGSSIDTAKCMNILLSEGGNLKDYEGAQLLTRRLRPLVAIPTTAGTGSEVTMVAVIADAENAAKITFVDRYLTPDLAILDPELTRSLPRRVTAATGMDALTHAIEAYVDVEASPVSDAIAAQAMRLIRQHLPGAVAHGESLEHRAAMQIASMLAGVAFNHSMVGVVHAMAHSLGGVCHVAHGEANAIMLALGMEYNLDERQQKFAEIAAHLGADTRGLDEASAARKAVETVRELQQELAGSAGFPARLSEVGVPREKLPEIAAAAMLDGSIIYNPREVTENAVLAMLERAH